MHREQRSIEQQDCSSTESGCNTNAGVKIYMADYATTNKAAFERVISQNPTLHSVIFMATCCLLLVLIKMTLWMKSKLF